MLTVDEFVAIMGFSPFPYKRKVWSIIMSLATPSKGHFPLLFKQICSLRSNITEWSTAETKGKGPFVEILEYNIFVNCILLNEVQTCLPRY